MHASKLTASSLRAGCMTCRNLLQLALHMAICCSALCHVLVPTRPLHACTSRCLALTSRLLALDHAGRFSH
ncbi:hypothetical protein HBI85_200720 [Parastagonospora nodorum]|nr:hypothetical protein HBI85_200720 [Parastagonospora nodorum]